MFRLLHAQVVPLEQLGVGGRALDAGEARRAWRLFCGQWPAFRGTPVRFWMESVLANVFGVTQRPSPATADAIYDQIADALPRAEYRPRALMDRFGIEFLATTDDPADDLRHHARLRGDAGFAPRVVPTFRPEGESARATRPPSGGTCSSRWSCHRGARRPAVPFVGFVATVAAVA